MNRASEARKARFDAVRILIREGWSMEKIAGALGKTPGQVSHLMRDERYENRKSESPKQPPPPGKAGGGANWPRYERAFDLRSNGMTYTEIGRDLGVSPGRASQMVARVERRNRYKAISEEATRRGVSESQVLEEWWKGRE